jgi:hypothetical protein
MKIFIQWLGTIAEECNVYPNTKPTTTTNHFGTTDTKYTVPLREYIRFAEAIVAWKPPIEFPEWVQNVLRPMITKRKEHSAGYIEKKKILTASDKATYMRLKSSKRCSVFSK